MTTLRELGEDRVVAALLAQLPSAAFNRSVVVGAGGDDCAVVRPVRSKRWQLLKTDCVIEGVHFLPDTLPEGVGWKALCRPLSDIAATGGKPLHALVTLAVNGERSLEWATGIYTGISRAAAEFGVAVVGGDPAKSPGPSFLSVCVTASVRPDRCVTRGSGKPGDALFVTGRLGGSFSNQKHLCFQPRLAEGRWLARHFAVHAMMDLSDGLAMDLPRLAQASGSGFRLEQNSLPLSAGCTPDDALSDGEDYELLFAVAPEQETDLKRKWARKFPNLELTKIGTLQEPGIAGGLGDNQGFNHFMVF